MPVQTGLPLWLPFPPPVPVPTTRRLSLTPPDRMRLTPLLATILLHFLTNFLKFRESLFLDQCNDYCQVHVLAKLKLSKSTAVDE